MAGIDTVIVGAYAAVILGIGIWGRLRTGTNAEDLIVGGRRLTLPAFVASLVATWYGGILGVGEFGYLYGISQWLVFGLPYYVAALLFAWLIARRARALPILTVPDLLGRSFGPRSAFVGALFIFVIALPAAYVLILGTLGEVIFGWPFWLGAVVGSVLAIVYVYLGGFAAVVRTDYLQVTLMFGGFGLLVGWLVFTQLDLGSMLAALPDTHLSPMGGNSPWYIASWYVIALATLVDPSFYQRVFAARTSRTANRGLIASVGAWVVFDFLTTTAAFYARVLLPDLGDPVAAFPELAAMVLPVGILGLFWLALITTAQSSADSYFFIAASTFSRDIVGRWRPLSDSQLIAVTRLGLIVVGILVAILIWLIPSVVALWYTIGSIATPALLIPIVLALSGRSASDRNMVAGILIPAAVSLVTFIGNALTWWSLEPIWPGMLASLAWFGLQWRRLPRVG